MSENALAGFESPATTLNRIPIEAKTTVTMAATVRIEELESKSRERLSESASDVVRSFYSQYDEISDDDNNTEHTPVSDETVTVDDDTASISVVVGVSELSNEQKGEVAERARTAESTFQSCAKQLRNDLPDDCDCGDWNEDCDLPCWPCYRDGFETPSE